MECPSLLQLSSPWAGSPVFPDKATEGLDAELPRLVLFTLSQNFQDHIRKNWLVKRSLWRWNVAS